MGRPPTFLHFDTNQKGRTRGKNMANKKKPEDNRKISIEKYQRGGGARVNRIDRNTVGDSRKRLEFRTTGTGKRGVNGEKMMAKLEFKKNACWYTIWCDQGLPNSKRE